MTCLMSANHSAINAGGTKLPKKRGGESSGKKIKPPTTWSCSSLSTIRKNNDWSLFGQRRHQPRTFIAHPLPKHQQLRFQLIIHNDLTLIHPGPHIAQSQLSNTAHHLSFRKLKTSNDTQEFFGRKGIANTKALHKGQQLLGPGLLVLNDNTPLHATHCKKSQRPT